MVFCRVSTWYFSLRTRVVVPLANERADHGWDDRPWEATAFSSD